MRVICLQSETDFAGWRNAARKLLREDIAPAEVQWQTTAASNLFPAEASNEVGNDLPALNMPRDLVLLCQRAILHNDPQRFALLYRLLYRVAHDRRVWEFALDPDNVRVRAMEKAVRRDMHKMKAFVRFRRIQMPEGERYVAWFEPDHYIVEGTAPFFVRRFTAMRWSILTPACSVNWDGEQLSVFAGAKKGDAPLEDAQEELWLRYYASIFNPARLKIDAMQKEMPRKYWHNLPEASLIAPLIGQAQQRTQTMIVAEPTFATHQWTIERPTVAPVTVIRSLEDLHGAVQQCRECPLWQHATQAVSGKGESGASVMLVGEQPGDQEDLAGEPFIGPAGQLLNRALAQAGIDRQALYVTNAVRHFKFELRGKRRLHKTPAQNEVERCSRWLDEEIVLVQPKLIVALGATAARALLKRPVGINAERGKIFAGPTAEREFLLTTHPSALLRLPPSEQDAAFARFVGDLSLIQTASAPA